MKAIKKGFILPSAAYVLKRSQIRSFGPLDRKPEVGDVAYGMIVRVGQHSSLENASGRIHRVQDGSRSVFVFGNRYAPDFYEGFVPTQAERELDLLSQSGLIGVARTKNSMIKDPTRVQLDGYVCDEEGKVMNTRDWPLVNPKRQIAKEPRARMILVCGTSMNSGKSLAAAACCWVLSSAGCNVRAAKITGTASLKDILHMNDAGAAHYADFSYLGYPSTYLLPEEELLRIFRQLDLKYANNPRNFWVVEVADGIAQRETALLLRAPEVRRRIHRLILCANDAFGALGGLTTLRDEFDLVPDALSGLCSSSPLHVRELQIFTSIPIFNSAQPDADVLRRILVPLRTRRRPVPPVRATAEP